MCGIVGAIDLKARREFPGPRLWSMTNALVHRGPDDASTHHEPGLAMGARRLAIVGLENGRQPLSNEDGTVWVSCNGELFDYLELGAELRSRGHRLATNCDTELWAHLYEEYGTGLFEHAKGQFATAIWDQRTETLLLGRDRSGIAPLYYAERDGWLLWASEIKALLKSGLVEPKPDPKGVDHLFTFFCAGTTRTYFEGVKSIPPGHFLRIQHGRVEVQTYWDLNFPDKGDEERLEDPSPLIEELEGVLERSVARRLRCDVPVVSYLSGGLDSTLVMGLSSKIRKSAVPSFTIALDRAGPDERHQSHESAEVLGSDLTTIQMDRRSIAEAYPELIVAAEGPVLDTSCACLMRLSQRVHDHGYKVALTGEGADEAFAGYVWFKMLRSRDRLHDLLGRRAMEAIRRFALITVFGGNKQRLPLVEAMNGVRPIQQDMYECLNQARTIIYSKQMWDQLGDHDPFNDLNVPNPNLKRWDPLNQSLYVGYKVMLAGLLMISKGDRVAMHSSVETRYPFLDEDLIDFASRIAPEYKLKKKTEKWILRQVAARTLPAQIANRPKTMFRANFAKTFLGPDRPHWVDQLLSPESLRSAGYFDPGAIAKQRNLQVRLPRITPRRIVFDIGLTSVIATQLWHHLYCGGGLCDLPTWESSEYAGNQTPGNYKVRESDRTLPIAV